MDTLWKSVILASVLMAPVLCQNPEGEAIDHVSGLADSIKTKMLDLHNDARRRQGASDMNELEWSDELAKHSRQWADQCDFTHQFSADAKSSKMWPQGQNLYATTDSSTLYAAVPIWAAEQGYYNYDTLTCEPGKPCGHYTLAVWNTVQKVGCAYVNCPVLTRESPKRPYNNAQYVVCQYFPTGNYAGAKPFLKGKPCSECPNNRAFCQNGLCKPTCTSTSANCPCLTNVKCPYCQQRDGTTCACKCDPGFIGPNCNEVCYDPEPTCAVYKRKYSAMIWPKLCRHPSVLKLCPALCGKCTINTNKSWKCGKKTYDNFFSHFDKGAVKKGECVYPFLYNGEYYQEGQCFKEKGKNFCSKTENYDMYKTKAPCTES